MKKHPLLQYKEDNKLSYNQLSNKLALSSTYLKYIVWRKAENITMDTARKINAGTADKIWFTISGGKVEWHYER